jgi:hypothetical protein
MAKSQKSQFGGLTAHAPTKAQAMQGIETREEAGHV